MQLYPQLYGLLLARAACGSSTGPSGSVVGVSIQDFSFSPAAVTLKVGTTVKWTGLAVCILCWRSSQRT